MAVINPRFYTSERSDAPRKVDLVAGELGTVNFNDASGGSVVGCRVLQIVAAGAISIVPRVKLHACSVADGSAIATSYFSMAAQSTEIANSTPITASGLYKVYCDGCDLILDVGTNAAGVTIEDVGLWG